MAKYPKFNNFGEYIYWCYANIQMYFAARKMRLSEYNTICYMIRAKYFKGYKDGKYNIADLLRFNEAKLRSDNKHCWYCGKKVSSPEELTIDHIFPRSKGGDNSVDNIYLVCKNCNSSKGNKDIIEWFFEKFGYIPMFIIVHYIKLVYFYSKEHGLLDKHKEDLDKMDLPFNVLYLNPNEHELPTQEEYEDE